MSLMGLEHYGEKICLLFFFIGWGISLETALSPLMPHTQHLIKQTEKWDLVLNASDVDWMLICGC